MRKIMAAITLCALLATPAIALGAKAHRAYAQAPQDGSVDSTQMSAARVKALEDCTALDQKWDQRTWGVQQLDVYRACMAQHGQME